MPEFVSGKAWRSLPALRSPYSTLRLKLIDEASSKYFVGQEDLSDAETEHHCLSDHLIVEDEIRLSFRERQCFKQFPRKSPETGVILREVHAQKQVLKRGEQAVGNILVEGHSALQGSGAQNSQTRTMS